jgi:hypothetical protein
MRHDTPCMATHGKSMMMYRGDAVMRRPFVTAVGTLDPDRGNNEMYRCCCDAIMTVFNWYMPPSKRVTYSSSHGIKSVQNIPDAWLLGGLSLNTRLRMFRDGDVIMTCLCVRDTIM